MCRVEVWEAVFLELRVGEAEVIKSDGELLCGEFVVSGAFSGDYFRLDVFVF